MYLTKRPNNLYLSSASRRLVGEVLVGIASVGVGLVGSSLVVGVVRSFAGDSLEGGHSWMNWLANDAEDEEWGWVKEVKSDMRGQRR